MSYRPSVGVTEHLTPGSHGVEARSVSREKSGPGPKGGAERLLQPQQAVSSGLPETVSAPQHFSSQAAHLPEVSCGLFQGEVVEYVDDLLDLEETG